MDFGSSIARIDYDGEFATAWICSRDGYMLTAGHLFVDNGMELRESKAQNLHPQLRFPAFDKPVDGVLIYAKKDNNSGIDFALVKVDSKTIPEGAEPFIVEVESGLVLEGVGVTLHGFGEYQEHELRPARGEVAGYTYSSDSGGAKWLKINCKDASQLGYSGCPVVRVDSGIVVALQAQASNDDVGAESESINTMPIRRAIDAYPDLQNILMISQSEDEGILFQINAHLDQRKELHPSFALMRSFDRDILPQGKTGDTIPNANRIVVPDGGNPMSFGDFIRNSWSGVDKHHLLITGEGGVGKTVALLTFTTEKDFLHKGVAAVYIPLNELSQYWKSGRDCIDEFLISDFPNMDQVDEIRSLAGKPWLDGPSLVLLLDGYNEVPMDKRPAVDQSVRKWAGWQGVQVVTTSREVGYYGLSNMRRLELQPLSREVAEGFLRRCGVMIPKSNSMWKVIQTPLMLGIYSDVEIFKRNMRVSFKNLIEPPDSAGHLVWDYLIREFARCVENQHGFQKIEYAMAVLLILPYVCWMMAHNEKYYMSDGEFTRMVATASSYWKDRQKPPFFKDILQDDLNVSDDQVATRQKAVLTEETALLTARYDKKEGLVHSLMHQNFRDCLAAIHINNLIESGCDLPDEIRSPISQFVKDYLADIAKDTLLNRMWDINRGQNVTDTTVTYNLLDLFYRKFDCDLNQLNWSGMDLTHLSLFKYKKGMHLMLSKDSSFYDGTQIGVNCFEPRGHREAVSSVCFSPNGKLIASGSVDHTVRLWDMATGEPTISQPEGHGDAVTSVCFSPNGHLLASCSIDGTVRLWDVTSGEALVPPMTGHEGAVRSVCFSPDGSLIASGSSDRSVRLWDAVSGKPIGPPMVGHTDWVRSVCFSPDGQLIASGSEDGTVCLWNTVTRELAMPPVEGNAGNIKSVCFSPDGSLLAIGTIDGIRLWNTSSQKFVNLSMEGHWDGVTSVCFSPDGHLLVSGSYDRTVRLWNVTTGNPAAPPLGGHGGWVKSVSFSPSNDRLVVSGSGDGVIRLWDVSTGELVAPPIEGRGNAVTSAYLSLRGGKVAGGSSDQAIRLWSITTGELALAPLEGHLGWITSICFSPDGCLIASGSSDWSVRIWDTSSGQPFIPKIMWCNGEVDALSFSSNGRLIASGSRDGKVRIWETATGELFVPPLEGHRDWVTSVCFSPDGSLVASGSDDRTIRIWKIAANGSPVPPIQMSESWGVSDSFFSNNPIISEYNDGTMRRWNVADDQYAIRPIEVHGGLISSLCFSPDGSLVASGSVDCMVQVWDVSSGKSVTSPFKGHKDAVTSVCFSLDGKLIASSSDDCTVRVWDIEAQELTKPPVEFHESHIRSVYFSQDGSLFVIGSHGNTVFVWDGSKYGNACEIKVLSGIDLYGLNFSLAKVGEEDRQALRQNGVVFSRDGEGTNSCNDSVTTGKGGLTSDALLPKRITELAKHAVRRLIRRK